MATIVTRETGATAVNRTLTNAELDNNFINLNTDLSNKQPLDADLTAIAALEGTSGLLKKTDADTWSLDTSTYATQTYVGTQIANLVSSAPATLDTLNELATALGSDPNFATTVSTALGNKQPLDADLTAIAALSGTNGFLKKTGDGTWSIDTSTYLTSYTETDTLASVTGRGASTSTNLSLTGGSLTISGSNGANLYLSADNVYRWIAGTTGYGIGSGFGLYSDTLGAYFTSLSTSGNWYFGTNTHNSSYRVSISGTGYATNDFRAPIFYDSDDTGYYVNPNSSSNIGSYVSNSSYNLQTGSGSAVYHKINNTDAGGNYSYIQLTTTTGNGYLIKNRATGNSVGDKSLFLWNDPGPIEFVPNGDINLRTTIDTAGNINVPAAIIRKSAGTGYLSGNYSSAETTATTGAIYTIGGNYYPTSTSLNNIYGIGFTYADVAGGTASATVSSAWGLYVASNGNTRVFLDSDYGRVIASGDMRAPLYYDRDNTGYYVDPAGSSVSASLYGPIVMASTGWTGEVSGKIQYHSSSWYLQYASSYHFRNTNGGNTFWGDFDGNTWSSISSRAPIFYDSNDTTYYLDPNSTGLSLKIAGNIDLYARSAGWAEGIRVRVPSTNTWGGIRFTRDRGNNDGNWAIGYTGQDSTDDLTFWSDNNGDGGGFRVRITKAGTMTINGALNATTKSFLIKHPTKPNMKLRYGSLEGPENGVYVRGRGRGSKITLPDYWTALVDEDTITVTLTAIGKHQKLYVEKVEANAVWVANDGLFSGEPNYYYVVYAERKDVGSLEVEIPE
jgi:hypothetical protein